MAFGTSLSGGVRLPGRPGAPRPLATTPGSVGLPGGTLGPGPVVSRVGGGVIRQTVPKPPATSPGSTSSANAGSPGSGTGSSQDGSAAPQPSPYDAAYYNDLNNATLAANNKINTYNTDIANGATGLSNTLAQLAYNQQLAVQKAQNAENARGGFAQGALGQTLGNLGHAYQQSEAAATQKYAQQAAAWNQAIAGVQSGLSVEQVALGLASAARQAALTAKNPATAGTPTATTPTAPAPATSPVGGGGGTRGAGGGGSGGRIGGGGGGARPSAPRGLQAFKQARFF